MPTDVFRIPTGFHIIAQGCGTPLPWVSDVFPSLFSTPTELRRFSNTVPQLTQPRWGKRELGRFPTQGSGVPQPWALFLNPVGILNSNIRFSPLLLIAEKMWVMTRVQLGNEPRICANVKGLHVSLTKSQRTSFRFFRDPCPAVKSAAR